MKRTLFRTLKWLPLLLLVMLSLSTCQLFLGPAAIRFWNDTTAVNFEGIRLGSATFVGGPLAGYHTIDYYETEAGSYHVERLIGATWYTDTLSMLTVEWGGQYTLYINDGAPYTYSLVKEN